MAMTRGGLKYIVPIAVGLGAVALAPIAAVVLIGAFKPVARMAVKGGLLAGAFVRTATAATVTSFKDLAAEANAEIDANSGKKRG